MASSLLVRRLGLPRPWFTAVNRSTVLGDALAGLTNAAIVLPQGVAFAVIAGMPPEYGLFTAMITPIVAAIWGSSMIMVSGPTTAISAIVFATLSELAAPGTPVFVNLALTVTVVAGMFQLAAGFLKLGGLVTFVSHSVMVGFTAAAALLIAASQLGGVLGIDVEPGGGVADRVVRVIERVDETSLLAVVIAASTLVSIVVVQRINRRLPAFLVALAVAVLVGELTGAEAHGVAMFARLPSILPAFHVPSVDLGQISTILPGAASIAFVGLLESLSIGRSFALRRREAYDTDQEIVGQGLSNLVGGFFQAYVGAGSFTRSALNADSGAKTPISAVFAALFLLGMLFVIAPFIDRVPVPGMAAIILFVAYRLINVEMIRHVLQTSRSETLILGMTFLTGILVDLTTSIAVGLIVSLFVFLRSSARPYVAALAPILFQGRRQLRGVIHYDLEPCPQITVLRIDGPLFFASVEHLDREFRRLDTMLPGRHLKVLSLKGIGEIDLSGADFLVSEIQNARRDGGDFHISAAHVDLVRALKRMQVVGVLGADHLHPTKAEAIAAVVAQADDDICRTCRLRAFKECAGKPAPAGVAPYRDPPEIDDIYAGRSRDRGEHASIGPAEGAPSSRDA